MTEAAKIPPFEDGELTDADEYDEYFEKHGIKVYANGVVTTMEDIFAMKSLDEVLVIFHFTLFKDDEVNKELLCDLSDTFTSDSTAVVCFAFNDDIVHGRGEKVCSLEEALLLTSGKAMEELIEKAIVPLKRSKTTF